MCVMILRARGLRIFVTISGHEAALQELHNSNEVIRFPLFCAAGCARASVCVCAGAGARVCVYGKKAT